jgi:hypothetical protein
MIRAYYSNTIEIFLNTSCDEIFGNLSKNSEFNDELTQKDAWKEEIKILKKALISFSGSIYFEYAIPRMGRRIDVLIIINSVVFIIEFKVGETEFKSHAIDQVWDYALDMKNFHETSHNNSANINCNQSKII